MRFSVKIAEFSAALSAAASIAERKSTLPILENALLVVKGGSLTVAGSDISLSAETVVDVTDTEDGATSVNARRAADLVKDLPGETLTGKLLPAGVLEIRAGKAKYTLPSLPAADFPKIPSSAKVAFRTAAAEAFRRLIDATRYAALSDSTRPQLSGAYLVREGETTIMVCLDTKRLAMATAVLGEAAPEESIIIPNKALVDIAKHLSEADETFEMGVLSQTIYVRVGKTTLTSKLYDASRFPAYKEIMARETKCRAVVEVAPFVAILKRVGAVDTGADVPAVDFEWKEGGVVCRADGTGGSGVEEMEVAFEGAPLSIRFAPKFVIQALEGIGESRVVLTFDEVLGDKGAMLLETEDGKGPRAGVSPMGKGA